MTHTLIAWALQPRKWTKGHQVLSSNLAWATIQWQRTGTSSVKTRCGLRVPLPAAGPLNGDLFTIVYYADEADRLGVCKRCQGEEVRHLSIADAFDAAEPPDASILNSPAALREAAAKKAVTR